jgi:hypothetical protein
MIAEELKQMIEGYAPVMRTENPLFCRAREGTLAAAHLTHYVGNVGFLVERSPSHLRRAAERAREQRNEALAAHFNHKIGEEVGHEQWGRDDLGRLDRNPRRSGWPETVPAMLELAQSIENMIERDPTEYLAYTLFAEYFVTLLGPEWLSFLEERCQIPRASMTLIGNHAELDREHASEAFERVDELVGDPAKLPAMKQTLARTIALFARICSEAVEAGDRAMEAGHATRARAS